MTLRYSFFASLVLTLVMVTLAQPLRSEAANAELDVQTTCVGQNVAAQASWNLVGSSSSSIWVDISTLNNGWQESTFESAGPAPAGTMSASLNGLMPNSRYFIRLSTVKSNGDRDPSDTFFFNTPNCGSALVTSDSPPVTAYSNSSSNTTTSYQNQSGAAPVPAPGFCKVQHCSVDVSPGGAGSYIVPSADYCANFPAFCQANGVYWNPPESFCMYHDCFKDLYLQP